jgi:hypothetical protein
MKRQLRGAFKEGDEHKAVNTLLRALSNYCGPGGIGRIRHAVDLFCAKHDRWYKSIDDSGRSSYYNYNEADVAFLKDLKSVMPKTLKESIVKKIAESYFKFKRAVAPHDVQETPNKKQKVEHVTPNQVTGPAAQKRVSPFLARRGKLTRKVKRRLAIPPDPPSVESVISQNSDKMTLAGRTDPQPYKHATYMQPDYITRQLKYIYDSDPVSTGSLLRYSFRCNSVFDPCMDVTTNTDTKSNACFNGLSNYANQYQYYRVMANHVKVHFIRCVKDSTGVADQYATNTILVNGLVQTQNSVAVGVAIDPAARWGTRWDSITDWKQFAIAKYNDIDYLNYEKVKTIEFKYNPNEWNTGVTIVEQEPIWTELDKNPTRQDFFTVFAQSLTAGIAGYSDPYVKIIIEMDAVVQFREWSLTVRRDMYIADRGAATNLTPQTAPDFTTAQYTLGSNTTTDKTNDALRNTVGSVDHVTDQEAMDDNEGAGQAGS